MGEGGHLPLVSICAVVSIYIDLIIALVFSYKLTICLWYHMCSGLYIFSVALYILLWERRVKICL